ncbi:hypothetical protein G647_07874 [Cladophialophora carrionii CBS 160.54]|uniref:DUF7053 domain-containing protein n=1 Tax=Cladophialophora carrionii CBS 160.54 TaxID=1279043 RepID=V9D6B6_9EURO|nr:uncharacterized protein G647_07874 [Cladophialophora carrionii CBS 160.54]ETI21527.1 hypothetical protein G647_07874 [Cladophialophora carrionii CBS 160.54]
MSFLQTTVKSGWITDLVLPAPVGIQSAQDVIQAGHATALEMCTDPIFMAHLNPLVQSVVELPASDPKAVDYKAMARTFNVDVDAGSLSPVPGAAGRDDHHQYPWKHYAITDKLTPLPGYTTELTYYAAIRRTADGMQAFTNAGSGVTIYGCFSVKVAEPSDVFALDASDGKGWVVNFIETNELRCNLVLSYYIKATTDKSHRTAHARFKELWRERMREKGFDCGG